MRNRGYRCRITRELFIHHVTERSLVHCSVSPGVCFSQGLFRQKIQGFFSSYSSCVSFFTHDQVDGEAIPRWSCENFSRFTIVHVEGNLDGFRPRGDSPRRGQPINVQRQECRVDRETGSFVAGLRATRAPVQRLPSSRNPHLPFLNGHSEIMGHQLSRPVLQPFERNLSLSLDRFTHHNFPQVLDVGVLDQFYFH